MKVYSVELAGQMHPSGAYSLSEVIYVCASNYTEVERIIAESKRYHEREITLVTRIGNLADLSK